MLNIETIKSQAIEFRTQACAKREELIEMHNSNVAKVKDFLNTQFEDLKNQFDNLSNEGQERFNGVKAEVETRVAELEQRANDLLNDVKGRINA